jgi:hypothetical protein
MSMNEKSGSGRMLISVTNTLNYLRECRPMRMNSLDCSKKASALQLRIRRWDKRSVSNLWGQGLSPTSVDCKRSSWLKWSSRKKQSSQLSRGHLVLALHVLLLNFESIWMSKTKLLIRP